MALRNQPYFPLYVDDYLTDEKLNLCSASTQGVYIKILCILHKQDEYGKLLLKQKDKHLPEICLNFAYKLARLLPFTEDIIHNALIELLEEKVLYIENDYLCQKRMIKDEIISKKRAVSGSKGGKKTQFALANALAKSEANSVYVNVNDNENDNINNLMIRTFGRNPKLPEIEFIEQNFIPKFGYDRTFNIFKSATLKNFHSLETLWNNLDNNGNIKDKNKKEVDAYKELGL